MIEKELQNLIDKVNKLDLDTVDGNTLKGDVWRVSFRLEMQEERHGFPIQLTMNVFFRGQRVAFWGCEDENDTRTLTNLFHTLKRNLEREEFASENAAKETGKKAFKLI